MVNGRETAVCMPYINKTSVCFTLMNLPFINFRIYLLIFPGLQCQDHNNFHQPSFIKRISAAIGEILSFRTLLTGQKSILMLLGGLKDDGTALLRAYIVPQA